MSTYQILPETDMPGKNITSEKTYSLYACQKRCTRDRNCKAFVFNNDTNQCHLKSEVVNTTINPATILYIKSRNSSYWWLLTLLFLIFLIFLFTSCQK